ncbi:DUF1800 domain-containing protein [Erythrobacter insulae]|nr:DUF1800 family protein [Erythrobacter insulae]
MQRTHSPETAPLPEAAATVVLATSVAACGGDGSTSSKPSSGSVAASGVTAISKQDAARFLAQATNGTDYATIEDVSKSGVESWLNAQFALGRERSYWDWLENNGFADDSRPFALADWEIALWHGLLHDGDTLRQRVTLALLDIFVVGIGTLHPGWRSFSMANYLDILADHSFGNFRELIEAITFSTAMGDWLTYTGSKKADARGSLPDENYARELMQLFTLGLHRLNADGTHQLGPDGSQIPAYTQADVSELARVFTGFVPIETDFRQRGRNRERLVIDPTFNDTRDKVVLGQTISGGGEQAVSQALDILFNHPNVGPFISKQLILRLVTSNPSPAYVQRVARVFSNNGQGERGDLRAIVKAVLLDREARQEPTSQSGKLRDPAQRLLNWARAFDVKPAAENLVGPYLHGTLLKSPGWSPTVFNFFDAEYSPPLSDVEAQGLAAPGFQIASEQTVVEYINFINNALQGFWASRGLDPSFDNYIEVAKEPTALVERLNIVLAAGQISPNIANEIAVQAQFIAADDRKGLEDRVKLATLMILASPDFLVVA